MELREHLGKDVSRCTTQLLGGKTELTFTDGTEVVVYDGKDLDVHGNIQDIFGKMGTVPFDEVRLNALNQVLENA